MKSSRDIIVNLLLIIIFITILALVFYIFFYSGSSTSSKKTNPKKGEETISSPLPSPSKKDQKTERADEEKKKKVHKEQVTDRKPSVKKEEKRSDSSEAPEKRLSLDQLRAEMDTFVVFINQRALQQFAQEMVTGFEITDNGLKLNIYITKTWYVLPPFQKQVMFNLVALQYGKLTCDYKIRTECSPNDFPTINFFNPENKVIGTMAANQPLQIFE